MTTEQQEIGALIRAKRKEKKMTLAQLGKLLGVGQMAISHYEKGDTKVIPFEKRLKLADILDIDILSILYQSEKTRPVIIPQKGQNISYDISNPKFTKVESQLVNVLSKCLLHPSVYNEWDKLLKDELPNSTKIMRQNMIDEMLKFTLLTLLNKTDPNNFYVLKHFSSFFGVDLTQTTDDDDDQNTKK